MEVSPDSHHPERRAMGTDCARTRAKWVSAALPRVTAVCSLRRCYGLRERARPGVIYRGNSAAGSPSLQLWRWAKKGAWERIFKRLSEDPDFQYVS